jgi:coenzyme F420-reducing hydrogenase delta subunit
LHQRADALKSAPVMVVFQCDNAPVLALGKDCISANVRCMGALPPSFIDYALNRIKAQGVFLLGCSGGDCKHRLGTEWCDSRLARERDPMLRQRVNRQRIAISWAEGGTPEEHYQNFSSALDQLSLAQINASEPNPHPATVS